jgi:hypothetical protein
LTGRLNNPVAQEKSIRWPSKWWPSSHSRTKPGDMQ